MSQIQGTNVAAAISPFDTLDTYPTHDAQYGKGGYRSVATVVERDAIPTARRTVGMCVNVTSDPTAGNNKEWKWTGSAWEDASLNLSILPDITRPASDSDLMSIRQGGLNKKATVGVFREEFATNAVAAEISAISAKNLAESARDSSFVNAKGGTTIEIARALVADNDTFIVYTPGALMFTAYRRTSSTTQVFLGEHSSKQYADLLYKIHANVPKNQRFLNRFDKNSNEIIAGYITNLGVVVPGGTIGEGVTVVTPPIGVLPGETLYLSQFSSNTSLVACYDQNLNITGAATMNSTFIVPAGVFYIQFSMIWKALAYISSHYAAYYDFGYTLDDYQRDFRQTGLAASAHKTSLAAHAGLSNLADSITSSALVDASGVLTVNAGGIHPFNRIVSNRVPVVPGTTIKLTTTVMTAGSGYVAEYDISGNFIQKGALSSGVDYTVSGSTCYYYAGFVAEGATAPATTLVNVTPQGINAKAIDSVHADVADSASQLTSTKMLKNVSLFATTIASQTAGDLTVTADADGFVFTALTTAGGFALFNLSPSVLAGEKYQLAVDYEVLELNCTSVQISTQTYFSSDHNQTTRTVTAEQVGVRNTLTVKSVTANGTNFTANVKTIASGSKINAGLAYFAKVRIRRVSIVTYLNVFENVQSLERVLGNIATGVKYFNGLEAQTYDKFSTAANFQGYNIVRADHVESTQNLIGKTIEISTAVPNQDALLNVAIPPALLGAAGFAYISIEVTLNTLNADYFQFTHRGSGGDEGVVLTRADIGKRRVIHMVRKVGSFSSSGQFFLIGTNRVFTAGVAGVGLDGGSPTVNLTIHNYSQYISESLLPTSYHADFFSEAHSEDLLTNYVKLPVQNVVINAYGDSITEHNYGKFIAADNYHFDINIYGLRGPISDTNGNGTGACNASMYGVMTDVADVVMLMFGTHDWGKNVPVGSIGTLDKATYIGAYEVLIRGLIAKYPNKIILPVSITPRNLTNTDAEFFNGVTSSGITLRDYVNALRGLCEHYGLPFVDAFAASGANYLTMTGNPNLYVPGTTSDNTLIDATGVSTSNVSYFTSDFINVTQGKTYGTSLGCFFVEYNGSTFIRRSPASVSTLYLHPNTTRVRLCVSKTETIIAGTTVGVGPGRFWFADQADACMRDRIHPEGACQARIAAEVSKVLKPVLDSRRVSINYQGTIYNNAD